MAKHKIQEIKNIDQLDADLEELATLYNRFDSFRTIGKERDEAVGVKNSIQDGNSLKSCLKIDNV